MTRRRALTMLAAAVALGCFRTQTVPPVEMYRLVPTDSMAAVGAIGVAADALPDGAVAVVSFVTPGLYGQRGIVYRVGDAGYGSYPSREWAIPLGEQLGRRTADLMQHRPLVRSAALFEPPSRRGFTYVWRGTVREFEEIDRGNDVFVAVNLEASLIRIEDDSIVWSGGKRIQRSVPDGTMEGIIMGLSAATDEVLVALLDSARVSIRQKSANGSGSPR
jgi:uncharacterized lipoprotein YmbA